MRKLKTLVSLAVITASIFISSTVANASQWVKEDNNDWKYLNNNNTYAKGWLNDNGTWYFMDANGIMKTGWLHDNDGKWYYLNQDGSMARNTAINGYTLGSDGAWVSGGSNNSSGTSGGTSSGSTVAPATSGSTGKPSSKRPSAGTNNSVGSIGQDNQSAMDSMHKAAQP